MHMMSKRWRRKSGALGMKQSPWVTSLHSSDDKNPTLTLSDAVAAVKQIKAVPDTKAEVENVTKFLGRHSYGTDGDRRGYKKHRIEYVNVKTHCIACGEYDHWLTDNPKCANMIVDRDEKKGNNKSGDGKIGKNASSFYSQRKKW